MLRLGLDLGTNSIGWALYRLSDVSPDRQQEVVERLLDMEDHDDLVKWLKDEFDLDEQRAEAVASVRLPAGTAHLSKRAIERLLPHMRDGWPYHEAVEKAGLGSHSDPRGDGTLDRLPYYGKVLERDVVGGRENGRSDVERFGRIANPTVHIALGQVRRLFNAIADRYGKPCEVVVELARELKQTQADRELDLAESQRNKKRNEKLRQIAADAGVDNPSPHLMRKLRLWREQGSAGARVCPFTGVTLSIERVLSGETEIEHILPYSRSLDDSMANTVLAMRSANREKGRKTPYEAWGNDRHRYEQMLARVCLLPANKQWRFQEDAMERLEERNDFLGRQLNETRYLSRTTRTYLQSAVHPDRVWVTPGRLTAMLRTAWGLNSLLAGSEQKERNDHRHHLIDAVVVGLTSRSLLQKVAHDSARAVDDLGGRVAKSVEDPWAGFRDDVKALVRRVVVRHRPDHFTALADKQERRLGGGDVTTGALHNETAYGVVDGPDARGMMTLVETKPLESLETRLDDVRDKALGKRLRDLRQRFPAEKWQDFGARVQRELGVRRVRVLTRMNKESLAFIRDRQGRVYKAYKTDGNAYMDIWLLPDGRTKGETISRFEAHQPAMRSKVKDECPTAKKLMRLHIDDMMATGSNDNRRIYRVQGLSGAEITAVPHNEGGDIRKRERSPDPTMQVQRLRVSAGQVIQRGLRKVAVDITGRVRDAGPFPLSGRRHG